MAVYKYISAANGLKYLQAWHLKYSTPSEFNDPFDVNPAVTLRGLRQALPGMQEEALHSTRHVLAGGLRGSHGVLCLSRTRKHPLMWAHYGDDHRGMLLEFDDGHNCFRREFGLSGRVGVLQTVVYSDERPEVTSLSADSVHDWHLIKALDWAHEQEVRMLWPSAKPDMKCGDVLLLSVPPAALRRIVIGCRASPETIAKVIECVRECREAAHVLVQKAVPNAEVFGLDYESLFPGAE